MISIAMATYNGEKYIHEQLNSILSQTVADPLEIVACDDCSNDKTREILLEYAAKDSRVKVFFNDSNLGFAKNFEKAVSLCNGEFIAFSDQDDIWLPEKLEELLACIGDQDFVCSNALLVDSSDVPFGFTMKQVCDYKYVPSDSLSILRRLAHRNFVQGSTMLVRSSFLKRVPSVPKEIGYHDWWLAFNSCANNGFHYIDKCLIRYRRHEKTVTEANAKVTLKDDLKRKASSLKEYNEAVSGYETQKNILNVVLSGIVFPTVQEKILLDALRYYSELADKTVWSFFYFAKNCKYIYLDKNVFRNGLRIIKRFFGVLYWHFYFRKKILGSEQEQ